jgi:hypothetical protein
MNNEAINADWIEVSVKGTFKTEHVFVSNNQIFGKMALNAAKSEGFFLGADETQLKIRKTSFWKAQYELIQDEKVICTASPRGALKRAFDINCDDLFVELKPGGSKLRSWTLRNSQGGGLCEFLPRKSLKRGARIRIGAEIPLPLIVLCYILVIRRWQEESSAS